MAKQRMRWERMNVEQIKKTQSGVQTASLAETDHGELPLQITEVSESGENMSRGGFTGEIDHEEMLLLTNELSECEARTQLCIEPTSLAKTDHEELLLLTNELSECGAKTSLYINLVHI